MRNVCLFTVNEKEQKKKKKKKKNEKKETKLLTNNLVQSETSSEAEEEEKERRKISACLGNMYVSGIAERCWFINRRRRSNRDYVAYGSRSSVAVARR